jgi:hypothetical protein
MDLGASDVKRLSAPGLTLIRPPASGEGSMPTTADLAVVVFPDYESKASFSAAAISKAEAGLNLMACLINARNLPEHGHGEVARVVREVPAFRVRYGSFAQVEPWLGEGVRVAGLC